MTNWKIFNLSICHHTNLQDTSTRPDAVEELTQEKLKNYFLSNKSQQAMYLGTYKTNYEKYETYCSARESEFHILLT